MMTVRWLQTLITQLFYSRYDSQYLPWSRINVLVSLFEIGCCYIAQEIVAFLLQSPECWNFRHTPSHEAVLEYLILISPTPGADVGVQSPGHAKYMLVR